MTDTSSLLNTADANVSKDVPSNRNNNVGYGTSSEQKTSLDDKKKDIAFPSCRHVLYLMMSLGKIATYSIRGCFNEAIIAMVNQTAVNEQAKAENITISFECPRNPELKHREGVFKWDRRQQSILLGAFYDGYILTQVTASVLSHSLHEYTHLSCLRALVKKQISTKFRVWDKVPEGSTIISGNTRVPFQHNIEYV